MLVETAHRLYSEFLENKFMNDTKEKQWHTYLTGLSKRLNLNSLNQLSH
ncbi:hypothetical protein IFVP18_C280103 [Vibrio parahaemolyticus]